MKKTCLVLVVLFCASMAVADAPRGFVGDTGSGWDTTSAVSTQSSYSKGGREDYKTINGSGLLADGMLHEVMFTPEPGNEPTYVDPGNMWFCHTGDPFEAADAGANEWWGFGRKAKALGPSNPAESAAPGDSTIWIEYAFDSIRELSEMWIWNYAEGPKDSWSYSANGLQNVNIKYTTVDSGINGWGSYDPADWTEIYAGDLADYQLGDDILPNNIIDFGGALAKYVVITVPVSSTDTAIQQATNWTDERKGTFSTGHGLSEVRFYEVPEPATMLLLGLGGLALRRRR